MRKNKKMKISSLLFHFSACPTFLLVFLFSVFLAFRCFMYLSGSKKKLDFVYFKIDLKIPSDFFCENFSSMPDK